MKVSLLAALAVVVLLPLPALPQAEKRYPEILHPRRWPITTTSRREVMIPMRDGVKLFYRHYRAERSEKCSHSSDAPRRINAAKTRGAHGESAYAFGAAGG